MVEISRGRPRSEQSRRAILAATRDLIAEVGYEAMTIEAMASRAGASRATIYRWWSSRAAVVADAVIEGLVQLPDVSLPTGGTLRQDLTTWIMATADTTADPQAHQVVRALVTAAADDAGAAEVLYEHITGPHYRALVARLERGQAVGQLPPDGDPLAVADALIGTVLFQILAQAHPAQRLARVVDALLPEALPPRRVCPSGDVPDPDVT